MNDIKIAKVRTILTPAIDSASNMHNFIIELVVEGKYINIVFVDSAILNIINKLVNINLVKKNYFHMLDTKNYKHLVLTLENIEFLVTKDNKYILYYLLGEKDKDIN